MIRFRCRSCSKILKVPDEHGGKKGKCPNCGAVVNVPRSPSAEQAEPAAQRPPAAQPPTPAAQPNEPAGPGPICPSCQEELVSGAIICVSCGIYVPSGRPVLMARAMADDEDIVHIRTEKVLRPVSWFMPVGVYPVYSEASGKSKPYMTWSITIITVLISAAFLFFQIGRSPQFPRLKNVMLWGGSAEPGADRIKAFLFFGFGDTEAFNAKLREIRRAEAETAGDESDNNRPEPPAELGDLAFLYDEWMEAPDRHLAEANKALPPDQRPIGEFRWYQLITHAFLHGGPIHLAGNLLFLLVLGSRVNTVVGNIGRKIPRIPTARETNPIPVRRAFCIDGAKRIIQSSIY